MYEKWKNTCTKIVAKDIVNWKNLPQVTEILEHLSYESALIYLKNLLNESDVGMDMIERICHENDKFGGARCQVFLNNKIVSTSSIRYFRHAYDICKLIRTKNYDNVGIIEVGGGYGGLCVILNMMAQHYGITITNYHIYDLPEIQQLQQYYLSNFNNINVVYNSSFSFGEDFTSTQPNNILISNYCLSEIDDSYKNLYLKNLIPKVKGAYMAWNWGKKTGLPETRTEVAEIPDTGNGNTIITW